MHSKDKLLFFIVGTKVSKLLVSIIPSQFLVPLFFTRFSFFSCIFFSANFSHSACFVQSLCRRRRGRRLPLCHRLRRQRHQRFAFVVCIFLAVFHLLFPRRFACSFVLLRWISTCQAAERGRWVDRRSGGVWVSVCTLAELQIEACTLLHFLTGWARTHRRCTVHSAFCRPLTASSGVAFLPPLPLGPFAPLSLHHPLCRRLSLTLRATYCVPLRLHLLISAASATVQCISFASKPHQSRALNPVSGGYSWGTVSTPWKKLA